MKKNLIAMAALIVIAGAAQAQSSVTLYGVADAAFVYDDNGTAAKTSLDSGKLSGSRWGLKGSEDLGSGMAAVFNLEAGYSIDTGAQASTTSFFDRMAFVGLTGNFGAVKLGRQINPVYANLGTFDSFAAGMSGDTERLFGNNGTTGKGYNGNRTDNLITYNYSANGFRGEVQYGFGEVAGNTSAGRTIAGFVGYKKGPIDAVLTVQDIRNTADTDTVKVILLGGNYDLGVVKVFAAVASEKNDLGNTLDQRDVHLGLTAPIGSAGTLMLSYINKKDNAVVNHDANQYAIGYTYSMSKRTTLYTSYGQLSNDSAASYQVTTAGNTDKLFIAGVRHTF